jgi:hypothetical protein
MRAKLSLSGVCPVLSYKILLKYLLPKVVNTYQTTSQLEELVWRVPIANQEMSNTTLNWRATSLSRQGYEDVKRRVQFSLEEHAKYTESNSSYINMMGYCHNCRPFLSTRGYVGLAPRHSQVGDMICILLGAHLPFLLRKREDGKTVELVGEVYVHGIMYGEPTETGPKIEVFSLK